MLHPQGFTRLPFSTPCGFNTLRLAHVLDSLVRVSRRVVRNRFVYNQVIGQQPYLPIYQEESPSKLSSPYLAVEESPVAAYTCYKPSPICTRETGQRHAVVKPSLSRRPAAEPKQATGIGRVTYSYHSSVSGTFNSLFKVLCIFPSLYLFAIGLRAIFSLSRGTPADLFSTPKLNDSCRP